MIDNILKDPRFNQTLERCTEHGLSLPPGEFTCIACDVNPKDYSVKEVRESAFKDGHTVESNRILKATERKKANKLKRAKDLKKQFALAKKNQKAIDSIKDEEEKAKAEQTEKERLEEEALYY